MLVCEGEMGMAWGEEVEQPLFHFLPLGENQGLVMAWNRGKKNT